MREKTMIQYVTVYVRKVGSAEEIRAVDNYPVNPLRLSQDLGPIMLPVNQAYPYPDYEKTIHVTNTQLA